jgi:predicted PurR-regulated permease PerM
VSILVQSSVGVVSGLLGDAVAFRNGFMSDSSRERFSQLIFYALIILIGYLTYLVMSPFLAPLAWAAVFAVMFYPVHRELSPRIGPSRSALAATLMTAVLIVAPAVMLVSVIARETPQVIDYLKQMSNTAPEQIDRIWEVVRRRSPTPLPEDPTFLVREGAQRVLAFLAPHAGAVVADLFATLGSLFVMLFAMFFLLRDGHTLARQVRDLLPLPEAARDRLMTDTRDLVVASVGAGLMVAAVQGAIGALSFWLLGINAPVIWGVVMALCSLIPLVGAALVWVPTALWLLLSGDIGRGVILVIVGIFAISLADNILRPLLLAGRTTASGLIVFLGLLGGAAAFGFIGLVLGPIILVTAGSLLRVFSQREPFVIAVSDVSKGTSLTNDGC